MVRPKNADAEATKRALVEAAMLEINEKGLADFTINGETTAIRFHR